MLAYVGDLLYLCGIINQLNLTDMRKANDLSYTIPWYSY
jgi:hypothetical protein